MLGASVMFLGWRWWLLIRFFQIVAFFSRALPVELETVKRVLYTYSFANHWKVDGLALAMLTKDILKGNKTENTPGKQRSTPQSDLPIHDQCHQIHEQFA